MNFFETPSDLFDEPIFITVSETLCIYLQQLRQKNVTVACFYSAVSTIVSAEIKAKWDENILFCSPNRCATLAHYELTQ